LSGSIRSRARAVFAAGALVIVGAALAGFPAIATSASGRSEYVSKRGHDTSNCTNSAPCKTINHAISRATRGETIHVEKGTYHQTVNVNRRSRFSAPVRPRRSPMVPGATHRTEATTGLSTFAAPAER